MRIIFTHFLKTKQLKQKAEDDDMGGDYEDRKRAKSLIYEKMRANLSVSRSTLENH